MYPNIGDQEWITTYGLFFLLALAATWWLARRNATAAGIDPSHIDLVLPLSTGTGLAVVALVGTGVKLVPLIVSCSLVLLIYSRLARQPFRTLVDVFALPVIVAISIQRIGCFLAGCCWGDVVTSDDAWGLAVQFPAGSFAWEQQVATGQLTTDVVASLPVHPTQLYEAALLVPVAFLLHRISLKRLPGGSVALLAVASYALLRFGIEFLRADSLPIIGYLTMAHLLCLLLLSAVVVTGRLIKIHGANQPPPRGRAQRSCR